MKERIIPLPGGGVVRWVNPLDKFVTTGSDHDVLKTKIHIQILFLCF